MRTKMDDRRYGVLLTAFGGPDSLDAVGPFMAGLMGREPSPEAVTRARAKYEAIGGSSPLTAIAERIRGSVEDRLTEEGLDVPVRLGMRYWHPYIAQAVEESAGSGVRHIVMVSLSPFESKVSSGACRQAVFDVAEERGLTVSEVSTIHKTDGFLRFFMRSLDAAMKRSKEGKTLVVFTAHSLPVSDLEEDDPYVAGLRETASAIASGLDFAAACDLGEGEGLGGETFGSLEPPHPWVFAYQSKGMRPGAWLGPDLDDVIDAAASMGFDRVVLCPIGFMTDHMETLYDLDIVAAALAEKRGLELVRTDVPNDDPLLIEAIVRILLPVLVEE